MQTLLALEGLTIPAPVCSNLELFFVTFYLFCFQTMQLDPIRNSKIIKVCIACTSTCAWFALLRSFDLRSPATQRSLHVATRFELRFCVCLSVSHLMSHLSHLSCGL